MQDGTISLGLAFAAGLVSFLSPCVLPLVPGYLAFLTGMSLDELSATRGEAHAEAQRGRVMVHAALFVLGFSIVFITLGTVATALGTAVARALPVIERIGGALVALFGLSLLGVIRPRWMMRDGRIHLASRPAGMTGSVVTGMAFAAGWTPCVGPVLATILLYAGTSGSISHGMLLLTTYAMGLGLPFLLAAFAFDWWVARSRTIARWLRPLELTTGALLVVMGVLLATGHFRLLTGFLAGLGQLVTLRA